MTVFDRDPGCCRWALRLWHDRPQKFQPQGTSPPRDRGSGFDGVAVPVGGCALDAASHDVAPQARAAPPRAPRDFTPSRPNAMTERSLLGSPIVRTIPGKSRYFLQILAPARCGIAAPQLDNGAVS